MREYETVGGGGYLKRKRKANLKDSLDDSLYGSDDLHDTEYWIQQEGKD